jgi:ankyrin repeat protein
VASPLLNGPVAVSAVQQTLFNSASQGSATIINNAALATAKDTQGYTPMHCLAMRKVVTITGKATVATAVDSEGETPLHALADQGCIEVLQHASVAKAKGFGGWTPLNRLADSVAKENVAALVDFLNKMPDDPEKNMDVLKRRGLI